MNNNPTQERYLKERNFRMPAEWEPQKSVWLSWPHNLETWPDNLAQAQLEFTRLVQTIAPAQPVVVLAASSVAPKVFQLAQQTLGNLPNVTVLNIPTNDAWARDYAPTFATDFAGNTIAIDWHYNAWGGKYPPFDDDQKACSAVARHLEIESVSPGLCFEGGAIEVNGSGVLLSTKSCVLDPNRNRDIDLKSVDAILAQYLGTSKHIWMTGGEAIYGDDTDGHIDQLARFTDEKTIVYAWTEHENDPQLENLKKNRVDLQRELKLAQLNFRLVPLPIPAKIEYCQRRIPASYCNFLITNELVIVPQFKQPEDKQAIEILASLFPNHQTIGLCSLNLSVGLGSFHCLSQQQPA